MATSGLNAEQMKFYQDNGYILVKGVFPRDEANAYRTEGHELIARLSKIRDMQSTWASVRESHPTKVVLHCHDVQFYSAKFARLLSDTRLTSIAQSIIGPNVQLHHCKMFIKPPEKGAPFPMHQDYPYFPHQRNTMIAAVIHFDDAPLEKGCLRVVPGTHKMGVITPDNKQDHSYSPSRYSVETATPCPAQAGDVLFFSYLTIHGSGVNTSSEARTTLLIQMRDPTDPPTVRAHESLGQGMMLAGIDPSCRTTKPLSEPAPTTPAMGGSAMGGSAMGGSAMGAPAMGSPVKA